MLEIQKQQLERSVRFIASLGCSFKVITPDGEEFGELEVTQKKKITRSPLHHPYGDVSAQYKPQINLQAEIGSVQRIDYGKFGAEEIRGGVCSYLSKRWGKKTYTTLAHPTYMEILRVA